MPLVTAPAWEDYLREHTYAHILQTIAWGEFKCAFGWDVVRIITTNGIGAQILFRRLPGMMTIAYLPKGPIGGNPAAIDWELSGLWYELDEVCRRHRAIVLKVEPDNWDEDFPSPPHGFVNSFQTIQPRRTLVVDLSGGEQAVLSGMKQKTRYNIRLAQKKGLSARISSDIESFSNLMCLTGKRDAFGVHTLAYYQQVYKRFHEKGECELLVVEHQGQLLAAIMVFARGRRAWYFYGASSNEHRELMPTYLVQWEAICWALQRGCLEYDLWGVPDYDEEILEQQFTERNDGLWGVYRFKRGFGGELRRSVGVWDRIYNPILYKFYRWWITRDKSREE
jgi:peptidoglycan pentaglycine glycine transferase (the first glycine)